MPHAITVLAPGFEETEAVTTIDLLRRAGVKVTILGLTSREVSGSHDITIIADALFTAFDEPFDALVLPGGMPGAKNLAASLPVLRMVRRAHDRGALCAAICAAPMVLGRAGILAGVKVTCFPGFENDITGATLVEQEVVRDGHIITSRGLGTAIPFALALVAYLVDAAAAGKIRESILYRG
ncbi:MAG: DJ-1/PfpI family protein [Chitinispirillaceae bacterium]|jgi:4-methyl-5(b-hydroxyethyl)-thiazole monophosphate biosynthesis|nr:DJ-1/PfpI family protein [Chitinispirillaceae bacterium]